MFSGIASFEQITLALMEVRACTVPFLELFVTYTKAFNLELIFGANMAANNMVR
jgi:hypothetical protein